MALADRDRFIKIMMLTSSPSEGEALNAIRMANGLLMAANLNWEEFLGARGADAGAGAETKPRARKTQRHTSGDIEEMFEGVSQGLDPDSSFYRFIESLHTWWEEHGFLTDKQYEALKNSYERVW